jgi:hypothetical protein
MLILSLSDFNNVYNLLGLFDALLVITLLIYQPDLIVSHHLDAFLFAIATSYNIIRIT